MNKKSKHCTKKERVLIQKRLKYEQGTLTEQELRRLPTNAIITYLQTQLTKQFETYPIKINCLDCGIRALYYGMDGNITDEELLKSIKTKHSTCKKK